MQTDVYLFVPGIWSFPGADNAWIKRAVTHVNAGNHPPKGDLYEYLGSALLARFGRKKRQTNLAEVITKYLRAGHRLHIVGHSNAANEINGALKYVPLMVLSGNPIHRVVLISPACRRDMDAMLLYRRFKDGFVRSVDLWSAGQDKPLIWARYFGFLFGGGDAGAMEEFEYVGLFGEVGNYIRIDSFAHSEWFAKRNFPTTMAKICGY